MLHTGLPGDDSVRLTQNTCQSGAKHGCQTWPARSGLPSQTAHPGLLVRLGEPTHNDGALPDFSEVYVHAYPPDAYPLLFATELEARIHKIFLRTWVRVRCRCRLHEMHAEHAHVTC